MPRDENAIVGRKKTTNRVVQTMLQRKSGFFYTTNTVYIHDKMCHTFLFMLLIFFMLKDQNLSFEICCENTMTGKRNATGQVYSSMVLSYM